ncbi:hypothetical protein M436DRAFT_40732 [Aureobasidium namibiae CBS 147.97]|uniref:MYND-type domain-containing protein n=1 Tax=Aureobasidium namibiae CBS 147.97 TaxID=1043004 RepID=A0A074WSP5_9PEZI
MGPKLLSVDSTRIPGFPGAPIHLDRAPLRIIDDADANFDKDTDTNDLTTAIGITNVLYRWCPFALHAFLDIDAWFSFTWTLTIQDEMKIEIGRVENQITIGTLDAAGEKWTLMLTFNITTEGPQRGAWVPNPGESMLGDNDLTDPAQIDRLGREFVRDLCLKERWTTGKKMQHQLFVEYALMDPFSDGIPMNPHWLYKSLDLSLCTKCGIHKDAKSLQRCGRCGTAAYCCPSHQKQDWPVHKSICNMSLEDRGQMLKISQNDGLIGWDLSKTVFDEDEDDEETLCKNPNFVTPQLKRARQTNAKISTM